MARVSLKLPENVPGDFFVDSTCIDCDLCRQLATKTFKQTGEYSTVYRQPQSEEEQFDAFRALVTCPTASIGGPHSPRAVEAANHFPEQIKDEVYFCGYASEDSFGAASYLIVRPEGNVLVDSPRFAKPLVKNIEQLGGIRFLFLTHRDDIADHALWAKHFKAERIMHQDDAGRLRNQIERLVQGKDSIQIDNDLTIIPTPGHTKGHMVLLHRNYFLFTGDHIWWSERYDGLNSSQNMNWYSWTEQVKSLRKLLNYEFEWILPGHGRRAHATAPEMKVMLETMLERFGSPTTRTSSLH
jgi:glyoxylase-like metal-dependent hydrolase (beta-lactamase superfamily II)/ferredoxin